MFLQRDANGVLRRNLWLFDQPQHGRLSMYLIIIWAIDHSGCLKANQSWYTSFPQRTFELVAALLLD
jgi:hypothetical protein